MRVWPESSSHSGLSFSLTHTHTHTIFFHFFLCVFVCPWQTGTLTFFCVEVLHGKSWESRIWYCKGTVEKLEPGAAQEGLRNKNLHWNTIHWDIFLTVWQDMNIIFPSNLPPVYRFVTVRTAFSTFTLFFKYSCRDRAGTPQAQNALSNNWTCEHSVTLFAPNDSTWQGRAGKRALYGNSVSMVK